MEGSAGGSGGGTTTVPPPTLSIAISPTTASIVPNGKLTFSVGVSNATNPAVTLTVNNIPGGNATVGTITSGASVSGTTPTALYQAPAAPPVPNTVMVTATSVQDPTKSATALVVITNTPPAVTVNVTPSAVSVAPGAATPFTTAVTGTANTSVSWAVNGIAGGNNIVGLISPQGVYTAPLAPPSPPSVTVTATSLADPTASGSASVTVQVVVNVTVSPTVANVVTGTPLTFTAVVTGSPNTNVQWSVAGVIGGNATVGTIGITTGVYNAPAAVPAQATVTVTATSVADPTKSDSAQLTITAPNQVGVSVAPATTMVAINGIQQFIATVTGTANTLVTWSVNGTPGGTVAAGTITATGLYTAPGAVPIPNTVTVSATSVVANISGTATVQVTGAGAVNVSVAPAVTSIQTSSTQQFAATVTGTTTTTVTWSVNGMNGGNAAIGTISGAGLYTAPASVPTPATVTITATSTASPSSSGSAALTIILLPAPVVVTVAPTSGSLKVTSQFLFTATVSGAPVGQTGVNWSVNGVAGGNASVGTISSAGLYTAPSAVPSPATVQVKATSQFQSNSSATSNITILPQDTITMTPTAANVQVGLGAQFFVTITGLSNTAVTFKVNGVVGGNSTVGTVSASGLYLAPAVVPTPATVSLTATSVADLTLIATSTITISPLVVVTVAPTTKTLALSGVQTFTATVTGTANTAVNWSVNGVAPPGNATVGLITNTGQYTAPASLLLTSTFTVTATSVVNPAALANALVTVNVPVGVTVAPSTPTVAVNGTIAFSATVTGATNTAVTWSVSGPANPGTINSASGVYTAPAAPPAGAVTITATSQANPAATGSTTVTVQLPVSVNLTPNPVNVDTGTTQAFTATVMNAVNTAVTWTVNGAPNGNASVGTINPSTGVYTAPNAIPTPATVTVTATSVADPTKSASSSVTVTPLVTAVSVSPLTPSIATNGTQQFSATVTGTGNLGVTWQVNGTTGGNINTVGSISASGLYTAPSFTVVTTATMFTITAVSVQNPGVSGSTTITVTPPPITVTVSPDPVTVTVNATQQFTVVVTNAQNPAVTWSVVGVAANGTINSVTGLYTAPPAPPAGAVTVLAVSNQNNTKSDTATVTVVSGIAVTVSPAKTNVIVGTTQQFTATVTGTANQTVTWSVVGGAANGSINVNSGLYTAPATVPAPASVTVVATSAVAPNPNGSTTLTVVPAVVVTVAPTPISLNAGGPAQVFTATVTGTSNTAVTWFVNGVMGGNATVGTIVQATGLYTPPAAVPNPAVVTVTAVSQADPTKSGAASVTIQGVITVSVSPATVGVNINTTQQFSATVTNASNPAVNWTISGTGNIGSIGLTTGLYTAPSSVPTPATVTVTATSVQNGTSQGTATITVQPVVSVSISPNAASLNPNQQSQFTATVTGSANTAVTWTVNGIAGGNSTVGLISASGLYTAPAIVPSSPVVSVTATSAADPTKSASAAVTISAPGAGIFVTVFPRNKRLKMGQKSQFDSHVFLTPNTAVNWSIGGPSCAGAGNPCGTIDPVTMIFTTPAALPANPNITVTATSQADPTKSDTQNERLILGVEVMPESADPHITETVQFSAFVRASSNQSLNWFVNGIPNGNATVGTISNSGLYTAPGSVPNPGFVTVSAISVADPTLPGVATIKVYGAKVMKLFPTTVSVLPGWRVNFQHFTNVVFPVTAPSFGLLVNWSVNGVVGGNSTVGTITNYGQYAAPASPQTVTVAVQSTINPSFTAQATVTITSGAGASAATLLDTFTKVRPYDIISGTASLNVAAAHQEYADWQVLVTANGEDLTGVDVNVSNFTDGLGNVIPSSNATIYFERPLNVFYPSRFQYSDVGEWPDPMVPKVDPFVHETRNAFPFGVNRISPAYKRYPVVNVSDTTNVGMGAGKATSGGVYTGTVQQRLDMVIDAAGAVGTATFKWSTNGGTTFQQTGVKTSTSPVTLANGVTVSFQAGGVSGVADFNVGDTFWIFAGPLRNQPVWFDLYIPMPTPAGNYTGTVTVTESGKAPQILTVNLQVYTFAIPVSSSFPSRWGAYWQGYEQAHYFVPYDPNLQAQLGKLYGTACLINRMSCETNTVPNITYSANGMVATADYTGSDQTLAPLANGTITPHGEQLTAINQNLLGGTDTQMYFSTQNQLAHAVAKGWRSRLYDYTYDEPSGPAFPQLTARASLVRSVDITFRTLVTTDISDNLIGFVSRYVPNWVNIGLKEYQRGPTSASRSFYNDPIANGDDLWWYDSCTTQGCGSIGFVPYNDNYPNSMADTSALMNRCWGIMGLIPYQVTGVLYFDSSYSFDLFLGMNPPRVDTWDSIFYFSGNGDGSLFYPGRPSVIGGTTHIPVESFRMKQIRDAFVDMEYGLKLQNQGDGAFLATNVLQVVQDIYTYEANPATWAALRKTLGQKIK
ncbi:MAG TPA: hypothetical protein VGR03_12470 [Candidatus Acidoferrum sp.]|nr:hypothetical protein [Candidatus Acidoferrum sp.]